MYFSNKWFYTSRFENFILKTFPKMNAVTNFLATAELTKNDESIAKFKQGCAQALWDKYRGTGVFREGQVHGIEDISCLCTPGFAIMCPSYFSRIIDNDHALNPMIYRDIDMLRKRLENVQFPKHKFHSTQEEFFYSVMTGLGFGGR